MNRPLIATTACSTGAAAAAACCFRPSRSGSGGTSGTTVRSRRAARSSGGRSTSASPTSTSRTTTARRTARRRRTSAGCCGTTWRRSATSSSSRRRPATTCGPARTASGAPASTSCASLDQSLARMGLDYVDIFYSHRFDPETPLEETMGALDAAVRQGKALYVGISSYSAERTARGRRDPARAGHTAADPPAVVLDAEPLDRAGSARHAGRARGRLHRLLPAGPGPADRPLPRRHPRGLEGEPSDVALARPPDRGDAREDPGAPRDRGRRGVRRWRRWPWRGRSATRA